VRGEAEYSKFEKINIWGLKEATDIKENNNEINSASKLCKKISLFTAFLEFKKKRTKILYI
jgi:hypothetical protein